MGVCAMGMRKIRLNPMSLTAQSLGERRELLMAQPAELVDAAGSAPQHGACETADKDYAERYGHVVGDGVRPAG